jgi:hypothetical protein
MSNLQLVLKNMFDELTASIEEAQGGKVAQDALVKVFGDLQDAGVPIECIEGLCDEMTAERVSRPRFDSWVEMAKENGGTDVLLGRLADILGNIKRLKGKLGKVAKAQAGSERSHDRVTLPGETGLVVTINCSKGFRVENVTPPTAGGDPLRYMVALTRAMQAAAARKQSMGELGARFSVQVTDPEDEKSEGDNLHKASRESLGKALEKKVTLRSSMPDKRAPRMFRGG